MTKQETQLLQISRAVLRNFNISYAEKNYQKYTFLYALLLNLWLLDFAIDFTIQPLQKYSA